MKACLVCLQVCLRTVCRFDLIAPRRIPLSQSLQNKQRTPTHGLVPKHRGFYFDGSDPSPFILSPPEFHDYKIAPRWGSASIVFLATSSLLPACVRTPYPQRSLKNVPVDFFFCSGFAHHTPPVGGHHARPQPPIGTTAAGGEQASF